MGDPFLNYFALGLLIFVVIVLFYGIIAIHDIPYLISKSRQHPRQDAIDAAGWVSLFTLVAVPLDLGDGIPPGTRLGNVWSARCANHRARERLRPGARLYKAAQGEWRCASLLA
jgi:hypothetical protein